MRPSDPSLFNFIVAPWDPLQGSSVFFLRDAAWIDAETRKGAHIYCGNAASFHEWEFRTRLRIAGNTGDQYIEPMSKVCDGLRGDAFVAAQEIGFDNLCEIIDGRPRGIDTLIQPHARNVFFLCMNTSPKNYFDSIVVPEDPCPDTMEKV